jgi:hypothetical protein
LDDDTSNNAASLFNKINFKELQSGKLKADDNYNYGEVNDTLRKRK